MPRAKSPDPEPTPDEPVPDEPEEPEPSAAGPKLRYVNGEWVETAW